MINSLRLQRFKNFRDAKLRLGPLTIIVGTNASGKSNLRDAFRFLHGLSLDYTLADIVGDKFVDGKLQWQGVRGGSREIAYRGESVFTLETRLPVPVKQKPSIAGGYQHRISIEVGKGTRPLRVVRESLYRKDRIVYDSHPLSNAPRQGGQSNLRVRLRKRIGQTGIGKSLDFIADQPVLSQFVSHEQVPGELKQFGKTVLSHLRSMRFLDLSPDFMRLPSIPGQPLGDRGENLSSVLQAICEEPGKKQALAEWVRQLTPLDVDDFDFVSDQTGRILLTLIEKNGQRTSAYSASDGTLRFLAIIAALMGPDTAKFYFLEELDNGIHPTRLYLLLQLIEQHARQGKVQVVATTHSPQLLSMLSSEARDDSQLVYRLENETEAHIEPIMELPSARTVLGRQQLSRLHESGWLEKVVAFSRPAEDAAE